MYDFTGRTFVVTGGPASWAASGQRAGRVGANVVILDRNVDARMGWWNAWGRTRAA